MAVLHMAARYGYTTPPTTPTPYLRHARQHARTHFHAHCTTRGRRQATAPRAAPLIDAHHCTTAPLYHTTFTHHAHTLPAHHTPPILLSSLIPTFAPHRRRASLSQNMWPNLPGQEAGGNKKEEKCLHALAVPWILGLSVSSSPSLSCPTLLSVSTPCSSPLLRRRSYISGCGILWLLCLEPHYSTARCLL